MGFPIELNEKSMKPQIFHFFFSARDEFSARDDVNEAEAPIVLGKFPELSLALAFGESKGVSALPSVFSALRPCAFPCLSWGRQTF